MALEDVKSMYNSYKKWWQDTPLFQYFQPGQDSISQSTPITTPPVIQATPISVDYGATGGMSYADTNIGQQAKTIANLTAPRFKTMTTLEEAAADVARMTANQTTGLTPTDDTVALANAINTQTKHITEIENARLMKAARQNSFAAVTRIASTIAGGLEMNDYMDEVNATKEQYDVQKQIIDTNINNSEALLMEKYRENMADLDAVAASKNVDPTSSAIQSIKEQGAIDMGKDFALRRSNAEIQKLALDLDFARSKRIAARQTRNYWDAAAWDVAKTGINYIIGG